MLVFLQVGLWVGHRVNSSTIVGDLGSYGATMNAMAPVHTGAHTHSTWDRRFAPAQLPQGPWYPRRMVDLTEYIHANMPILVRKHGILSTYDPDYILHFVQTKIPVLVRRDCTSTTCKEGLYFYNTVFKHQPHPAMAFCRSHSYTQTNTATEETNIVAPGTSPAMILFRRPPQGSTSAERRVTNEKEFNGCDQDEDISTSRSTVRCRRES